MPYYAKVLRPDETLLALGRLHWLIYLRGATLLALALAVLVAWATLDADNPWRLVCAGIALVFGGLGLVALAGALIRRAGTEIAVTDKRVIYKRGLLRRTTVEMNITKIETVDVIQPVLGRLLNYGTVVIRGTGAGLEPLPTLADPLALRNAIIIH